MMICKFFPSFYAQKTFFHNFPCKKRKICSTYCVCIAKLAKIFLIVHFVVC